jgi:hypothetical protein
MTLRGLRIHQKDPTMMVKLETQHGTLDTVIIRVFVAVAADPGEIGLVPVALDFFEAGLQGRGRVQFVECTDYGV